MDVKERDRGGRKDGEGDGDRESAGEGGSPFPSLEGRGVSQMSAEPEGQAQLLLNDEFLDESTPLNHTEKVYFGS